MLRNRKRNAVKAQKFRHPLAGAQYVPSLWLFGAMDSEVGLEDIPRSSHGEVQV